MNPYVINSMKFKSYLIFLGILVLSSCIKQAPVPIINIQGTYRFEQVIYAAVDNYSQEENYLFSNGSTFINPNEFPGLDTIKTASSLVQISAGQLNFNALITPNDTLWGQSYPAQTNCLLTAKDPYFSFYPFGMKRIWKLIDYSDSTLVITASTQWPQANAGPAYQTTYLLKKLP